jgi:hypothetical protein
MNQLALVLLVLAAVSYFVGAFSRVSKFQIAGHDPTVWWRGSMGLLGFSIALMIWRDFRSSLTGPIRARN